MTDLLVSEPRPKQFAVILSTVVRPARRLSKMQLQRTRVVTRSTGSTPLTAARSIRTLRRRQLVVSRATTQTVRRTTKKEAIKDARDEVRELIKGRHCNPILVRVAWHDSGTYDKVGHITISHCRLCRLECHSNCVALASCDCAFELRASAQKCQRHCCGRCPDLRIRLFCCRTSPSSLNVVVPMEVSAFTQRLHMQPTQVL